MSDLYFPWLKNSQSDTDIQLVKMSFCRKLVHVLECCYIALHFSCKQSVSAIYVLDYIFNLNLSQDLKLIIN